MNTDRVDTLAQQATDQKGGLDRHRFARLIIEECAQAAEHWYSNHHQLHWDPGTHVRAHFSLEYKDQVEELTCPRCGAPDGGTSCGLPDCGWITG